MTAYLARLTLTDFRSYAVAEVAATPGLMVVTGDNGQGKTNLLEAISLLSPGRGLRGAALPDMARQHGRGGFAVASTLDTADGSVDLGTGTRPDAPERRLVRINGASASAAALGEWLALLWVTPAMDGLFMDTPGARRRFLDRLVLALVPAHGREVTRYEAAVRARTRLLADGGGDPAWLASLERAVAEHGVTVATARADAVAALGEALDAAPDGAFPRARLALVGWDEADAETFARVLAARRDADAAAGRALFGPHRVDLIVSHRAKDRAAAQSSTGEQKALLLGLILAHADLVAARTGRRPILLLDEVAAHLDASRRGALYDRLATSGAQAWLTGTDAALFEGIAATRLRVDAGAVRAD